jgi:RNA polymerase sigma factor (sigma-70 family)
MACVLPAMSRPGRTSPKTNAKLLSEVLATSSHLLLRQARRHAQLPEDAEEALQSSYALFLERFNHRCEPLAWLYTTIKREAWRIAKRSSRRRELAITAVPRGDGQGTADLSDAFPDPSCGPGERSEQLELQRHREAALARLKPDERTALLLFALGYSYVEIAALCDWTYTKVNRCVSEGRAVLGISRGRP